MMEMLDKNFVDNLQFVVYLKDIYGKYTYCNDFMANIIGVASKEDVIGKFDVELFVKESVEQLRYVDERVISNAQVMVLEEQVVSLLAPCEEKINFLSIKAPFRNKDNEIVGIVGISINLIQQDMADFNQQLLEGLIHSNVLSALRQVKHDIRGPLGAVAGFAELIVAAKNEPDKIVNLANFLLKSCSAMDLFVESLTNSCLYYQNKSENHRVSFNLDDLLQNIYDITAPIAYKNRLELKYLNELDAPFVLFGFKDVIFRILMELTNNALKHTKNGEVILKAYFSENVSLPINIDVFNTGDELEKEQISRILNTSELGDDSLVKGRGFGLGMVSVLAKSIGADIKVSTSKTLGTTITLMLRNDKTD